MHPYSLIILLQVWNHLESHESLLWLLVQFYAVKYQNKHRLNKIMNYWGNIEHLNLIHWIFSLRWDVPKFDRQNTKNYDVSLILRDLYSFSGWIHWLFRTINGFLKNGILCYDFLWTINPNQLADLRFRGKSFTSFHWRISISMNRPTIFIQIPS